ncbi:MAG: LytTR family transcriptional regulator DNA-binding domain-containing protein, partial [Bacteroidota bacterium]
MSAVPLSYPDRWLRLIAVPLIAMFMQHVGLSFEEMRDYVLKPYWWNNASFNISSSFILWELCRWWIRFLDRRFPYEAGFAKRLALQIGVSVPVVVLASELLTFIYVRLMFDSTYWDSHWHTDIPFIALFVVLINFIYIGLYLQVRIPKEKAQALAPSPKVESSPSPPTEERIAMKSRKETLLVELKEIVLISSEDKLSFAYLSDGRKLLIEQSLKQLAEDLPEDRFFQ